MPRNRARTPSDEGAKKTETICAKVTKRAFSIVNNAALIRAWPRQRIVEEGALRYAQEIVDQAAAVFGKYRRETRRVVARKGGLAKAARRRA